MFDVNSILKNTPTLSPELAGKLLKGESAVFKHLDVLALLEIAERECRNAKNEINPDVILPAYMPELLCEYLGKDCSAAKFRSAIASIVNHCEERAYENTAQTINRITLERTFLVKEGDTLLLSGKPSLSSKKLDQRFNDIKKATKYDLGKFNSLIVDISSIEPEELQTLLLDNHCLRSILAIGSASSFDKHAYLSELGAKFITFECAKQNSFEHLLATAQYRAHVIKQLPHYLDHFIVNDYSLDVRFSNGNAHVMFHSPQEKTAFDPSDFGDLFHYIKPSITFQDVIGNDQIKDFILQIVEQLRQPDSMQKDIVKGMLFSGAPGLGKTYFGQATASALGIPFIVVDSGRLATKGSGVENVKQLFALIAKIGRCLVFFDEFDSLGRKRESSSHFHGVVVNTLLECMDGAVQGQQGAIFIAATNHKDLIDTALLRAGRFEEHIEFAPPTEEERCTAITQAVNEYQLSLSTQCLKLLSKLTAGKTFKALHNLVRKVAHTNVQGENKLMAVFFSLILQNESSAAHYSAEQNNNLLNVKAIHEAGHFICANSVFANPVVDMLSAKHGVMLSTDICNRPVLTMKDLSSHLIKLLGGRAAEAVCLGNENITVGSRSDIEKATTLARSVIFQLGAIDKYEGIDSTQLRSFEVLFDQQVAEVIQSAYEDAKQIIRENITLLRSVSSRLMKNDYLLEEELQSLTFSNKVKTYINHNYH